MDSYDFPMDFVGGNEPPPSFEELLEERLEDLERQLEDLERQSEK